jgi:hypothetical protein
VYLVPIGDVPERAANLRVVLPLNGQTHGIRWAKDYVIWPVPAERVGAATNSGRVDGDDRIPADGRTLISGES